jgi:hypothetical protein
VRMNWFEIIGPFIGLMLVLWILSRLIVSEASPDRKALESGSGTLNFVPNRQNYWGIYGFLACLGYIAVSSLFSGIASITSLMPAVVCSCFALLLLGAFPGSIAVRPESVAQFYWLWRERRFAWADIKRIEIDEKRRRVTITNREGKKIVHTKQLQDRERFLAELEKRCPDKMPTGSKQNAMTSS